MAKPKGPKPTAAQVTAEEEKKRKARIARQRAAKLKAKRTA